MKALRLFPICGALLLAAACAATSSVPPVGAPAAGEPQASITSSARQPALFTELPSNVRLAPQIARSQRELAAWMKSHPLRKRAPFRASDGGTHLWIADQRGAIWETTASNRAAGTGKKIVGALYDCNVPLGMKVDAAGRLWAACVNTGTVNMYPPGATKAKRVLQLSRTEGSTQIFAYPDDVAIDSSGNVYVANVYTATLTNSSYTTSNAEIDVFLAKPNCGNLPCNHATPDATLVNPHANLTCPPSVSGSCQAASALSFIDTDCCGNLYQDFYDAVYSCTSTCKPVRTNVGLDLIRNPLDQPYQPKFGFKSLLRNMTSPGGVYVTGGGNILNVLDSSTDKITRYELFPFKKIGMFGPTPQNPHFGDCVPVAMGFNKTETLLAVGDQACHDAIIGTTATNKFLAQLNLNYGALAGAAFDPSDK